MPFSYSFRNNLKIILSSYSEFSVIAVLPIEITTADYSMCDHPSFAHTKHIYKMLSITFLPLTKVGRVSTITNPLLMLTLRSLPTIYHNKLLQ